MYTHTSIHTTVFWTVLSGETPKKRQTNRKMGEGKIKLRNEIKVLFIQFYFSFAHLPFKK